MSDNRMTNDTEKLYERLISDPVIRLQPDTILKFLERLHSCHKQRILELEAQLKELREVTPHMLKAAQLGSELGEIATSGYAGAYHIMTEMYQTMFDAAMKGQDHE